MKSEYAEDLGIKTDTTSRNDLISSHAVLGEELADYNRTYSNFKKELECLINRYGIDSFCGTHDFILMEYLIGCMENFKKAKEHYELMRKS